MRRRLTTTVFLLVLATVVLTSIGSFVLVRNAAIHTAESELSGQTRSISTIVSQRSLAAPAGVSSELRLLGRAGNFSGIRIVQLRGGAITDGSLPSGVTLANLNAAALESGYQVVGNFAAGALRVRDIHVFSAVPITLPAGAGFATAPGSLDVLVITRGVQSPANGVLYFLLVAAVALGVGFVVSNYLATRFLRPIAHAVGATRRVAAGDYDVRVPVERRHDEELVHLADSVNAMAVALEGARDQERQFLLSVSHELRTPLTSIRGYADAVLEGAVTDVPGAVRIVRAEAERLGRLIDDLLALARIDAGRFSVDLRPVDISAPVRTTIASMVPVAAERGVRLLPDDGLAEPHIAVADPDRVAQVVSNLLDNAIAYASSEVRVAIVEGAALELRVSDDGPGVAPGDLPRLFERHFRSDVQPGRRRGSGLGLAIVSELMSAMGGGVSAASPAPGGAGTAISVRFPPTAPQPDPGS